MHEPAACPDENQLARFAQGSLVEAEAVSVEGHLERCEACLEAVTAAIETVEPNAMTTGLNPGTRLGGYVVEGLVGVGGMGAVYVAHDEALGRKVALKLVAAGADEAALTRLEREAQAIARLTHPNVVTVFALLHQSAQRCIAMEFVEGPTLAAWGLAPRPLSERLRVLREAGEGLAAAHAAGLVHRDFKPQNVLIGADGRARVSDFGLSRASPGLAPQALGVNPMLTQHGAMLGTPAYMAPEQLAGLSADARSDQFAFCVTFVECLTGQRPWSERTVETLRVGLHAPPRLEGLPVGLRSVVQRGLALEPAARFPSMSQLLAALRVVPPRPRQWWRVAALAATLAMTVGAAVVTRWRFETPVVTTPTPSPTVADEPQPCATKSVSTSCGWCRCPAWPAWPSATRTSPTCRPKGMASCSSEVWARARRS